MKRILITGGAGNIGGSLASRLVENSSNYVVIFDNLSTGSLQKLPVSHFENWQFIQGDVNKLADLMLIFDAHKFDYIFHYAAVVGVKRTLDDPIQVLEDIDGIKNILNCAKNNNVKRVFFSSSSEVYGEPVELPLHENTTPLNSRLPYAIVKNVGEAFFRSYFQKYGLEYTTFRFFNTYGPRQSPDFVISKFIKLALKNEDITIYGDGQQTRTFCYISDNLDTIELILENNLCINTVINIGCDIELTILELANRIIEITNSKSKIIHLPALKEGDMSRRLPDTTLMKNILKRDLIDLDEGIRLTIKLGRQWFL